MKRRISLIIAAVLCILVAMAMSVCVSADQPDSSDKVGKMTVVYLRDNGTGDGSDYANAVGTLEDAYMMLDLSKDCTIVVCDVYTYINSTFSIGAEKAYTGSVTFTSCYGGYDYRTIGAKFEFDPFRFICWGETKFEYIEFHTPGTNMLVVGQHNPVTVGEGVKISGAQMTGGSVAKSFCILGGYQKQRNDSDPVVPPMEDNRDTNITVMSGQYLYIVPFSRQANGNTYMGTAHVKIGGDADVSVLHGSAIGTGTQVGNVEIELSGNAVIGSFYGATETGISAKSFTLNWKSGTFKTRFEWECSFSNAVDLTVEGNTVVNASPDVKAQAGYDKIAPLFDQIGTAENGTAYVPAVNPNSAKPGDDILKAPTTTKTPNPPAAADTTAAPEDTKAPDSEAAETTTKVEKETKPVFTRAPRDTESSDAPGTNDGNNTSDGNNNSLLPLIIGGAAAVVVAAVIVVVIISKKKRAE